jgi:HEAT repeat protein
MPEFQPYLNAIARHYDKWWNLYTLTDAEGREREQRSTEPFFDFGLTVQTIVPKDEPEHGDRSQPKIERFPVTEGLQKYALAHVLLVGRPGSGKSTALARLMLDLVKGVQIPVLVELRSYQSSILKLIRSAFKRHDLSLTIAEIETLLDDRKLILLIDGVNELPSESARNNLSNFRRNYSKVPMIFTTRDLGLGGDLGIEKKLEMQPLTETQMRSFVHAYLPGKADAILGQLRDRLWEFGTTPLLLWMLCEVFDQAPDEQLPNNLAGIFKVFTRMYEESSIRKHEVAVLKGDVQPLSDRRLWKPALKHLASVMMQGEKPIDFRIVLGRAEAEEVLLDAFPNEAFPIRDILDDLLKYHLLQNKTPEIIEFRHQLIQEYYAAEWLLERVGRLDDETLECDYLNYLKWTEPLALMLALVDDEKLAVRVVEQALAVDLMLGARLVGEVRSAFQEKTVDVVRVKTLDVSDWLKVEMFGKTQSTLLIPELVNLLNHPNIDIARKAARFIGDSNNQQAINKMSDRCKEIDSKFFAQTSFGGPDKTGKLWIKSIQALAYLAPNSATQYLQHRLVEDLRHRTTVLSFCPTALPLFMKLESKRLVPELIIILGTSQCEGEKVNYVLNMLEGRTFEEEETIEMISIFHKEDSENVKLRILDILSGTETLWLENKLFNILTNSSNRIRKEVEKQLIRRNCSKTKDLEELIYSKNFDVAFSAAIILGHLGHVSALPCLLSQINSSSQEKRIESIKALRFINHEDTISALTDLIEDPVIKIRREAAFALSYFGKYQGVETLLNCFQLGLGDAHTSAIRSLARLGITDPLINRISNRSLHWQTAVVELVKLGNSNLIINLCDVLFELRDESSSEVIDLLSRYADREVIDWLINGLANPTHNSWDPYFCNRAALTLNRLSGDLAAISLGKLFSLRENQYIEQLSWLVPYTQNQCKFYNYEIQLKAIDRKPTAAARGNPTNDTYYDIKAEVVQIIENNYGTVTGNNNSPQEPPC